MPSPLSRSAVLAAYAVAAFWLIWIVLFALTVTVDLPFFHIDGAFQTASGLYRLNAGLFPGRDFLPYLGVGPLYLMFVPFKLLGANLAASTATAWIATLLSGTLASATVMHLATGQRRFAVSFALGSTLFLLPLALIKLWLPHTLESLPQFLQAVYIPGDSLRPLRAFAPYLMVLLYSAAAPRLRSAWSQTLGMAVLAGAMLLWSNDYAYPTALVFGLLFVFVLLPRVGGGWAHRFAYAIAALLVWFVLLAVLTAGSPLNMLSYNFLDVAKDQWWLFAPYDDTSRIYSLAEARKVVYPAIRIPLLILLAVSVLAWRRHNRRLELLAALGWTTYGGGMLASIGGHLVDGYFSAFMLWTYLTCIGLVISLVPRIAGRALAEPRIWRGMLGAVALVSLVLAGAQGVRWRSDTARAAADTSRFYIPELGGYLPETWRSYIQLARNFKGTVIEEYWGLFSATRRSFSGWHVDAVIHAMGSQRAKAAAALPDADLMISTRTDFHPAQQWSMAHDYWFYRELALHRKVIGYSPATVIWTRKTPAEITTPTVIGCQPQQSPPRFEFNAPQVGYYELDAQYQVAQGGGRKLLMLQTNIKMPAPPFMEASINPAGTAVQQIVYVDKPGPNSFYLKGHGSKPFAISAGACSAFRLPVTDSLAFINARP
ncbi:hypothetical protein [Amantichitinum ursilacus]|uniref:Uncharacterized protein n=1 Tax=Amantichitinum ursilacus TaxID=857265 RepID=A0A0N0XI53_9NEIS|nr:hypothetical protein [Amantichitinum ursilacus]KPC49360.1 hypothetical protein WG78_20735 [Amantichitinum ursilacus]